METRIVDMSIAVWNGSLMWPRLVGDVQVRSNAFRGIRSTGWHGLNHPGYYDFGQPFPYGRGSGVGGGGFGHFHAGTHVEAPKYCIPSGITTDKIPLENLTGTGVIIDMRNKGKWGKIEAEDLEKATPKIEAGDFVVVNTGWHKQYTEDKAYEWTHYYPGLLPSAADWLINKKVKGIAGTWPAIDHSLHFTCDPIGRAMPELKQDYIREFGREPGPEFTYLYEGVLVALLKAGISVVTAAGGDIDDATGQRATIAAWPFLMPQTDAAMCRLVAIFEE